MVNKTNPISSQTTHREESWNVNPLAPISVVGRMLESAMKIITSPRRFASYVWKNTTNIPSKLSTGKKPTKCANDVLSTNVVNDTTSTLEEPAIKDSTFVIPDKKLLMEKYPGAILFLTVYEIFKDSPELERWLNPPKVTLPEIIPIQDDHDVNLPETVEPNEAAGKPSLEKDPVAPLSYDEGEARLSDVSEEDISLASSISITEELTVFEESSASPSELESPSLELSDKLASKEPLEEQQVEEARDEILENKEQVEDVADTLVIVEETDNPLTDDIPETVVQDRSNDDLLEKSSSLSEPEFSPVLPEHSEQPVVEDPLDDSPVNKEQPGSPNEAPSIQSLPRVSSGVFASLSEAPDGLSQTSAREAIQRPSEVFEKDVSSSNDITEDDKTTHPDDNFSSHIRLKSGVFEMQTTSAKVENIISPIIIESSNDINNNDQPRLTRVASGVFQVPSAPCLSEVFVGDFALQDEIKEDEKSNIIDRLPERVNSLNLREDPFVGLAPIFKSLVRTKRTAEINEDPQFMKEASNLLKANLFPQMGTSPCFFHADISPVITHLLSQCLHTGSNHLEKINFIVGRTELGTLSASSVTFVYMDSSFEKEERKVQVLAEFLPDSITYTIRELPIDEGDAVTNEHVFSYKVENTLNGEQKLIFDYANLSKTEDSIEKMFPRFLPKVLNGYYKTLLPSRKTPVNQKSRDEIIEWLEAYFSKLFKYKNMKTFSYEINGKIDEENQFKPNKGELLLSHGAITQEEDKKEDKNYLFPTADIENKPTKIIFDTTSPQIVSVDFETFDDATKSFLKGLHVDAKTKEMKPAGISLLEGKDISGELINLTFIQKKKDLLMKVKGSFETGSYSDTFMHEKKSQLRKLVWPILPLVQFAFPYIGKISFEKNTFTYSFKT